MRKLRWFRRVGNDTDRRRLTPGSAIVKRTEKRPGAWSRLKDRMGLLKAGPSGILEKLEVKPEPGVKDGMEPYRTSGLTSKMVKELGVIEEVSENQLVRVRSTSRAVSWTIIGTVLAGVISGISEIPWSSIITNVVQGVYGVVLLGTYLMHRNAGQNAKN
jgi:hypothetical protein